MGWTGPAAEGPWNWVWSWGLEAAAGEAGGRGRPPWQIGLGVWGWVHPSIQPSHPPSHSPTQASTPHLSRPCWPLTAAPAACLSARGILCWSLAPPLACSSGGRAGGGLCVCVRVYVCVGAGGWWGGEGGKGWWRRQQAIPSPGQQQRKGGGGGWGSRSGGGGREDVGVGPHSGLGQQSTGTTLLPMFFAQPFHQAPAPPTTHTHTLPTQKAPSLHPPTHTLPTPKAPPTRPPAQPHCNPDTPPTSAAWWRSSAPTARRSAPSPPTAGRAPSFAADRGRQGRGRVLGASGATHPPSPSPPPTHPPTHPLMATPPQPRHP